MCRKNQRKQTITKSTIAIVIKDICSFEMNGSGRITFKTTSKFETIATESVVAADSTTAERYRKGFGLPLSYDDIVAKGMPFMNRTPLIVPLSDLKKRVFWKDIPDLIIAKYLGDIRSETYYNITLETKRIIGWRKSDDSEKLLITTVSDVTEYSKKLNGYYDKEVSEIMDCFYYEIMDEAKSYRKERENALKTRNNTMALRHKVLSQPPLIRYEKNGSYTVYCPKCKKWFNGSKAFLSSFADDEATLWLINMVMHYRHEHTITWTKWATLHGNDADYKEKKSIMNESSKQRILRENTEFMVENNIGIPSFLKIGGTKAETIQMAKDLLYGSGIDKKYGLLGDYHNTAIVMDVRGNKRTQNKSVSNRFL